MDIDFLKLGKKAFPEPYARVYLVQGSDDGLKREAVDRLLGALLDDSFREFDYEHIDVPPGGGEEGLATKAALASVGGVPIASVRRVVVLHNVHRLKKSDADHLAASLAGLGELSCLVLVAGAQEYDAGKVKAASATSVKLSNAAAKHGAVVKCEGPEVGDLKDRLREIANQNGKTIRPEAMEILLDWSFGVGSARGAKGGDLLAATNELAKVIAYVGDKPEITRQDASEVAIRGTDDNIFRLLDAVSSRNAKGAIGEVNEMLRSGDKPESILPRVLVMLARQTRLLLGAKYLAAHGINRSNVDRQASEDILICLNSEMTDALIKRPFRLQALQTQARTWTVEDLEYALFRIAETDCGMKGIRPPQAMGMLSRPVTNAGEELRSLIAELCVRGK